MTSRKTKLKPLVNSWHRNNSPEEIQKRIFPERIITVKMKQMKILSQTDKLKSVRDFVAEAARDFGFDEEAINKISIAVDEACTNIIKHSYEFAQNGDIGIEIESGEGKFEIIVSHNGKSFNPDEIKPPDMKEYLSHYRRGGLGMHLMRSLMDRVEYKLAGGKRSEVHLIKYHPARVQRS